MGISRQIKKGIKEFKDNEENQKQYNQFVKSLPPMVEEVKKLRMNSETGKSEMVITLAKMDHEKNCSEIFKRKGIKGLLAYKKRVEETFHYIKGKYPQFVEGTPEWKSFNEPVPKMVNWFKKLFKKQ